MKKKILSFALILCLMLPLALMLSACGDKEKPANNVEIDAVVDNMVTIEIAEDDWHVDRTEPATWEISDGWVNYSISTEPNQGFYRWNGKGVTVDMPANTGWVVSSTVKVAEEMLEMDTFQTSMWLNVVDAECVDNTDYDHILDWTIITCVKDEDGARWMYWDSVQPGAWVEVEDVEVTAGNHDVALAFVDGKIVVSIDNEKVADYTIKDVNAETEIRVLEVILNTHAYDEAYGVSWKVPTIKHEPVEND